MRKDWANGGLLFLRIVVGAIFLYHGWPKILDPPILLGLPSFLGFLVGVVEVLFGILVILGVGMPWVTYPLMAVIVAALAFVQLPGCFNKGSFNTGAERDLLILAVLFILGAFGAGKYAVAKTSAR